MWLLYPANGRMIRPEMVKPVWMVKLSGKYKRPKRSYITKWNMYKEAEHMDKRADLPYNVNNPLKLLIVSRENDSRPGFFGCFAGSERIHRETGVNPVRSRHCDRESVQKMSLTASDWEGL